MTCEKQIVNTSTKYGQKCNCANDPFKSGIAWLFTFYTFWCSFVIYLENLYPYSHLSKMICTQIKTENYPKKICSFNFHEKLSSLIQKVFPKII